MAVCRDLVGHSHGASSVQSAARVPHLLEAMLQAPVGHVVALRQQCIEALALGLQLAALVRR